MSRHHAMEACLLVSAVIALVFGQESSHESMCRGVDGEAFANDDCDFLTSMVQLNVQISPKKPLEELLERSTHIVKSPAPGRTILPAASQHCGTLETSIATNGLPVCVEALIFALFSALSTPLGAMLGAWVSPMTRRTTGNWLAFGAGALVFAVATQMYGDALFALRAVSRSLGPFDRGCAHVDGKNICDEMFADVVTQIIAGLLGAGLYVMLNRWLQQQQWSFDEAAADGKLAESVKASPDESVAMREDSSGLSGEELHYQAEGLCGRNVALSMWLGMLLDSFPEALMLGLMTNRHQLSFGFLFAIFLANFPEAFSGAALLRRHGMNFWVNVSLWSSIFVVTGVLAMITSFIFPEECSTQLFRANQMYITAMAEGLTGGAMLAMMATAMLPEAYRGAGSTAGIYFVLGFVVSVFIQALDSFLAGPQQVLNSQFDVPGMGF